MLLDIDKVFLFFKSNSNGFSDFCIKNINRADFGQREIEIAEQGYLFLKCFLNCGK